VARPEGIRAFRCGEDKVAGTPARAAQYVRMSTDKQEYSTDNQCRALNSYAAEHGLEIVRTYCDQAKSGLNFDGRDALKQLIADVQTGRADFDTILVYDVSCWGRFQDSDESAYYEHVCKRAGIRVRYCAEPFENDGSPFSAIVKAIKRAMAGEYSRELSVKTFAGQSRTVERGFRAGGSAGFGMRRLLIDQHGVPKQLLVPGEHKSIHTDRVILIPGPPKEVEIVRWVFHAFVRERKSDAEIARLLNDRGITNPYGRPWSSYTIRFMLKNEKYIGNHVWNRQSRKLKQTVTPQQARTLAAGERSLRADRGQSSL